MLGGLSGGGILPTLFLVLLGKNGWFHYVSLIPPPIHENLIRHPGLVLDMLILGFLIVYLLVDGIAPFN